jgi:hypothetical protein
MMFEVAFWLSRLSNTCDRCKRHHSLSVDLEACATVIKNPSTVAVRNILIIIRS